MNTLNLSNPPFLWKIPYGFRMVSFTVLIVLLMSPVFYFLFNNYFPANFSFGGIGGKEVYLYRSHTTLERLKATGSNVSLYEQQINDIKLYLSDQGYKPKIIEESELESLQPDDTLFLIDAIALNNQEINLIEKFVENGGALVFNQYSGFSDSDGHWRGDAFIHKITGLQQDRYIHTLKKQTGIFMTPKVFSPLTTMVSEGPLMNVVYYEDIPLFKASSSLEPDMMLTDWTQYNTPIIDNVHLPVEVSGVLWHGFKGKGTWVYFNFPSYVFNSSQSDTAKYLKLFAGISHYVIEGAIVKVHPYLNGKNPVFISEDTEFRFENAHYFSDVVRDLKVPSTAFLVSSLAEKNIETSQELSKNPYIEIASHSHTHGPLLEVSPEQTNLEIKGSQNILEKLAGTTITGFRPPREEIDDEVAKKLVDAGYSYTMEKNKNHLYPSIIRNDLVVISRVGTDDFAFFAHHTFNEEKILEMMFQESSFINKLDGIYTLSVHTHLFSNPNNISVVRSILQKIQQENKTDFRQGRDIAYRIKTVNRIDANVAVSKENYIVTFVNNNPKKVSEILIRLYWPRFGQIQSIKSDTTGVKLNYVHNMEQRFTDITLYEVPSRKQFSILAAYR